MSVLLYDGRAQKPFFCLSNDNRDTKLPLLKELLDLDTKCM